jgi:hypothetical protein
MKIPRELLNGALIFAGIAVYFFVMELLGLTDVYYLRIFNAFFVFYGVNKTLNSNVQEGKLDLFPNVISAGLTSMIGVFLSVAGLMAYIYMRGGDQYLATLSNNEFIFGGRTNTNQYCLGVLFEGVASSIIVVLISTLRWSNKLTTEP